MKNNFQNYNCLKLTLKFSICFLFSISSFTCKSQWQLTNGPYGAAVGFLISKDNNIYAGAGSTYGIYNSSDNGTTWSPSSNNLFQDIYCALVNDTDMILGGVGGIFISSNGGNWLYNSSGIPNNAYVKSLVVKGNYIFAAISNNGIYFSSDYGANWLVTDSGITDSQISCLLKYDTCIFAGSSGDGIFRSADNGISWDTVNTGLSTSNKIILSMIAIGNEIFAGTRGGIYKSSDNGSSWTKIYYCSNKNVSSLSFDTNNIYATVQYVGVILSTNNGENWDTVINGLPNRVVYGIYATNGIVLANTFSGIYKTTNNGSFWTESNQGLANTYVMSFFPGSGFTLFEGAGNGIYLTSDNGSNWLRATTPFNSFTANVSSFAQNGNIMYAGTFGFGGFRSTDNGLTWVSSSTGIPSGLDILSLAYCGNYLFAGTWGNGGIYRSADNGATWSSFGLANKIIKTIVVNGNSIFAGDFTNTGIYLSTNNGTNWTPVNNGITNLTINSLGTINGNIFAVTKGNNLFISSDNGSSWSVASHGIFSDSIKSIWFDNAAIIAGTYGNGVYKSTDYGTSWASVNEGLGLNYVNNVVIHNFYVYAGSYSEVWRRPLSEIVNADNLYIEENIKIFPNPVTDKLNIEVSDNSINYFEIIDDLGKILFSSNFQNSKTIVLKNFTKGKYSITFFSDKNRYVKQFVKQ